MVILYQHIKFEANTFINVRDGQNPKSKMAAAAILNFRKNVISFCINYTCMANVDLHTKCGGNLPRSG